MTSEISGRFNYLKKKNRQTQLNLYSLIEKSDHSHIILQHIEKNDIGTSRIKINYID